MLIETQTPRRLATLATTATTPLKPASLQGYGCRHYFGNRQMRGDKNGDIPDLSPAVARGGDKEARTNRGFASICRHVAIVATPTPPETVKCSTST